MGQTEGNLPARSHYDVGLTKSESKASASRREIAWQIPF
jgi:hypothetical protein